MRFPSASLPGLLCLLALAGQIVRADQIQICRASPEAGQWLLEVAFDEEFDTSSIHANQIRLYAYSSGRLLQPDRVKVEDDSNLSLFFDLNRLDPAQTYALLPSGITFGGKPPRRPLFSPVAFVEAAVTPSSGPQASPGGDFWRLSRTRGQTDSDVYVSGEVFKTRGSEWIGSINLKFNRPWIVDWMGRENYIGPFFRLQASSDPQSDPNSMNFGLGWEMTLAKGIWDNEFRIEGERDLDNSNFMWESRVTLIRPEGDFWRLRPFAGVELGKDIDSPVAALKGRFLGRLLAGTAAVVGTSDFNLEAAYIRRWLLREELSLDTTDPTGPLLSLGQGPRDHVTVQFSYAWTRLFGTTVSYEWGELPPSYNLVDHRVTFGFLFKGKWATHDSRR